MVATPLVYDPYDYAIDAEPASGLEAAARRGARLLQRAARLLRAEPLRRRARRAPRSGHVQLRAHDRARDDGARTGPVHDVDDDLHGPAAAHALPQAREPRVHAAPHVGARAAHPRAGRAASSTSSSAPARSTTSPTSARRLPVMVDLRAARRARGRRGAAARVDRRDAAHRSGRDDGRARDRTSAERSTTTGRRTSTSAAGSPRDDIMSELMTAELEEDDGSTRLPHRRRDPRVHGPALGRGQRDRRPVPRLVGGRPRPVPRRAAPSSSTIPALIPNAVEEILRWEAPSAIQGRWVTRAGRGAGHGAPGGVEGRAAHRRGRTATSACSPIPIASTCERDDPAPRRVRVRHPLLPRRRAGAARRPHRARGDVQAVPDLGRRPRPLRDGAHQHRPRLRQGADHPDRWRRVAAVVQELVRRCGSRSTRRCGARARGSCTCRCAPSPRRRGRRAATRTRRPRRRARAATTRRVLFVVAVLDDALVASHRHEHRDRPRAARARRVRSARRSMSRTWHAYSSGDHTSGSGRRADRGVVERRELVDERARVGAQPRRDLGPADRVAEPALRARVASSAS